MFFRFSRSNLFYEQTKHQIKNGYGVLEQIQSKSSNLIYLNLNAHNKLRIGLKALGKSSKFGDKIFCFMSIKFEDPQKMIL